MEMGSFSSTYEPCENESIIEKLECIKKFYKEEFCDFSTPINNKNSEMRKEMKKHEFGDVNMKQLIIDFEFRFNESGKNLGDLEQLYNLIVKKYEDDIKLANCDCNKACTQKIKF